MKPTHDSCDMNTDIGDPLKDYCLILDDQEELCTTTPNGGFGRGWNLRRITLDYTV